MLKSRLFLAIILAVGLGAVPISAQAKHKKHHHSSMSSEMKSGSSANPSSQGNVGPGTNQAGSMTK